MDESKQKLLIQRCETLIMRYNGDSHSTKAFNHFTREIQQSIINAVHLGENEIPIACCWLEESNWTLITTNRLASCKGGKVASLPWFQATYAIPREVGDILNEPALKMKRHQLCVMTEDGNLFEINLDQSTFQMYWKLVDIMILTGTR